MCNCINEVSDRIKNEVTSKNEDYANLQIDDVTCDGKAWLFTEDGKMRTGLSIPFTAHHQPVKRKTKTIINMIATYCPFCGNKYVDEN